MITTDEAPSSGEYADSSSCCGQPLFPNLPVPAAAGLRRGAEATVGALLISPYVKGGEHEPGTVQPLLAAAHDRGPVRLKHLGYARYRRVKPFEPAMFTSTPSKRSVARGVTAAA